MDSPNHDGADTLRMAVGKIDAAYHVVALPDHPNFFRRLDEIERLRWVQQLPRDAARVAPSLSTERETALPLQVLFIRSAHLRRRPGLQHRVFVIAHWGCDQAGPLIVAAERDVRILLNRAMPGARLRIEKAAD